MWKQKLFIILTAISLVAIPMSVSARGLVPCGGYTDSGEREHACTVEDIFGLAAELINFLVAASGVVAVFFIVIRGFGLVMSAGNDEAITKNKQGLSNAVIGFIIIILAFVMVNTVVRYVFGVNLDLKNPKCYLLQTCVTK